MNKGNIINRLVGRFEKEFHKNRLCLFKTLYINFRTLPLKQAIFFPVFVYGKTKLYRLNGNIIINGVIKPGIIKMGRLNNIYSKSLYSVFFMDNNSEIIFDGNFLAANGYTIHVKDNAKLHFGNCVTLGDNVTFLCAKNIYIGDYTQITYNCKVTDSNFHYYINLETKSVARRDGIVYVGKRNWIGNNSSICKGTYTGSGCIIASGSFLNKSFDNYDNVLLAGSPAVIKKYNVTRVLSYVREQELDAFFTETDEPVYYYDEFMDPYEDIVDFFR